MSGTVYRLGVGKRGQPEPGRANGPYSPRDVGMLSSAATSAADQRIGPARVSTLAGQVGRPVVHEPASALEQVCAPIGCLDPVLDHMWRAASMTSRG